jgi:hypothetical protein
MGDARALTRGIRETLWPVLRDAGFTEFKPRDAWQSGDAAVLVVNLWCLGAQAYKYRCTGTSFNLNVGVTFPRLQRQLRPDQKIPKLPPEPMAHVRALLLKGAFQKDHPGVAWYVEEDGSNLPEVLNRARDVLRSFGLPLLRELEDPRRLVTLFKTSPKEWVRRFGTDQLAAPEWEIHCGLARLAGDRSLADSLLQEAKAQLVEFQKGLRGPSGKKIYGSAVAELEDLVKRVEALR